MTKTKNYELLRARLRSDPERRARIEQGERGLLDGLALSQLRDSVGVTQEQDIGAGAILETNLAHIDPGADLYISAINDYITALGGRLEITAVFPDRRVSLAVPGSKQVGNVEDSEQKVSVTA